MARLLHYYCKGHAKHVGTVYANARSVPCQIDNYNSFVGKESYCTVPVAGDLFSNPCRFYLTFGCKFDSLYVLVGWRVMKKIVCGVFVALALAHGARAAAAVELPPANDAIAAVNI